MAHTEAQETFDRHLPIWKELGGDVVVFCPEDAPIQTDQRMILGGMRGHNGLEAIRRMAIVLKFLRDESPAFDGLVLHEYDSFCLEMPPFQGVSANWMHLPKQDVYIARNCSHPPVTFTPEIIHPFYDAFVNLGPHPEMGMWDRAFGLAMGRKIGMEHMNRFSKTGIGFSRNTIEEGHVPELIEAIAGGAKHFHGCKNERILNIILNK